MKNSRITYNRITPLHLRANGLVEHFLFNLNKILRIANMQKRNCKSALYNYLLTYKLSPNMSNKVPPALLLNNDKIMKDKMKKSFDNLYNTKIYQMRVGDCVLMKHPRINKLPSPFNPDPCFFFKFIKRSMETAERGNKSIT